MVARKPRHNIDMRQEDSFEVKFVFQEVWKVLLERNAISDSWYCLGDHTVPGVDTHQHVELTTMVGGYCSPQLLGR